MSVNKVILIGNVGNDPAIKTFDDGSKVANFPLATTERGWTKQDGTKIEDKTEWHNIVVSGGLSKVVEAYVKKGTKIYIEGKIRTREYEKDGQKRYFTGIYVNYLELLGSKEGQQQPESTSNAESTTNNNEPTPDENKDLPF